MLGSSSLELGRFVLFSLVQKLSQAGAWNFLPGHLLRLSGTGWTGCPWIDLDV